MVHSVSRPQGEGAEAIGEYSHSGQQAASEGKSGALEGRACILWASGNSWRTLELARAGTRMTGETGSCANCGELVRARSLAGGGRSVSADNMTAPVAIEGEEGAVRSRLEVVEDGLLMSG